MYSITLGFSQAVLPICVTESCKGKNKFSKSLCPLANLHLNSGKNDIQTWRAKMSTIFLVYPM